MNNLRSFLKQHDWILPVLVIGLLLASVYGGVTYVQTKARNQAIARARRMDGKVFTITAVANNLVGDTKLILTDENGHEAGWIAMYMANPFNEKINPLFLAFSNPNGRLPLPMKVRTRFRGNPWASQIDGLTKDNFTGSFLDFEIL